MASQMCKQEVTLPDTDSHNVLGKGLFKLRRILNDSEEFEPGLWMS